jgi:2-(1,2-epoxy-1,2-dihydrophenyl)acetyl-CoA isomerase
MDYEDIRYEVRGNAAWVVFNRPQVLNAVRWQTGAELRRAFAAAAVDPAIRFVVLTGEGRAFCAGDDVKQVFQGADFGQRYDAPCASRTAASGGPSRRASSAARSRRSPR